MRLLYLWPLLSLVALVAGQSTVNCPNPRVRKAWSTFSQTEKSTYIDAVSLAMKNGLHQRFVEVHMHPASEREAHACMFVYWHRAYLLAYENMLRSLGAQFACVTLPFWDYPRLGANFADRQCRSMLDCSDLLQDFGGSLPRDRNGVRSYTVSGVRFSSDNCVSSRMTENFCESTAAFNRKQCLGCMPRNDWSRVSVPAEVNLQSIYNSVLGNGRQTLEGVTAGIQYGAHNMVHGALGSVMGTFASPADPVFYAHHTMIDALHTIYYDCAVRKAVIRDRTRDSRTWTSCRNYFGRTILPTDVIMMQVLGRDGRFTSVWNAANNPLYDFFKDLPRRYIDYADTLGIARHQYHLLLAEESAGYPSQASAYGVVKDPKQCLAKQANWMADATALASKFYKDPSDVNNQVQMMLCVYYNECLGGVFDYSDTFKENFRALVKPPCRQIIDDLARNDCIIGVVGWEKVLLKSYTCNSPSREFA
ncbi:hypothetical protein SPRG_21152 [Saprolegnia parasitica CBS 223.65]|uniref:Tyrosinase copper-binding domain-containing protein n=1 Tax=Saprolegnia parasitica (strain CBS 223.65) TaxID=695850 RepID=A0A067BX73_SAPPC|nr:hypothetical protein SPRG_21152 [Saprolegnia parasitica CBS 223.65]KDO21450.1 hypothetical protein SPRG_21152 [Saprolegnia parasitica CBS 223.65]|eukprot:XP_012207838.1 hypothetical protein SPRG_21152 [Saprolegnia parasitica CBS 223.65]